MYCKNCGGEIGQAADFCGKCGSKVVDETQATSGSSVAVTASASRLLSAPNYLFLGLFFAHFVSYLGKGLPFAFALARSVGVNIIPLAFGIVYTFSGSKKSKTAYVAATIFFMIMFVGATLQSAKDGH
jgi:hypothetical protein